MIQITENKKEKLSEGLEKMLHIGGMLMQCVENLEEEEDDEDYESGSGMRGGYRRGGMRGGYRRGGMRNEDEYYGEAEQDMPRRRGGKRSRYEGEW